MKHIFNPGHPGNQVLDLRIETGQLGFELRDLRFHWAAIGESTVEWHYLIGAITLVPLSDCPEEVHTTAAQSLIFQASSGED
jgi:hypothetical protein